MERKEYITGSLTTMPALSVMHGREFYTFIRASIINSISIVVCNGNLVGDTYNFGGMC